MGKSAIIPSNPGGSDECIQEVYWENTVVKD